ncbi:hypothetical protein K438DRAFT_1787921 [Mycena galopus ATCC 62051]|nr:hypothetical protein K438DRAFT_1787921 [Mycena galopus ATCC 62051]
MNGPQRGLGCGGATRPARDLGLAVGIDVNAEDKDFPVVEVMVAGCRMEENAGTRGANVDNDSATEVRLITGAKDASRIEKRSREHAAHHPPRYRYRRPSRPRATARKRHAAVSCLYALHQQKHTHPYHRTYSARRADVGTCEGKAGVLCAEGMDATEDVNADAQSAPMPPSTCKIFASGVIRWRCIGVGVMRCLRKESKVSHGRRRDEQVEKTDDQRMNRVEHSGGERYGKQNANGMADGGKNFHEGKTHAKSHKETR